jgi:hypothetical protein
VTIANNLYTAAVAAPRFADSAVRALIDAASSECFDALGDLTPAGNADIERDAALDAAGELYSSVQLRMHTELKEPGAYNHQYIRALLRRADQAAADAGMPLALAEKLAHLG